MPLNIPTDGPPPSPVTDPAAAQEVGRPASQVQTLMGGRAPQFPAGPDVSGILVLGQKLDEGLLTLAQAVPLIAPDIDQMRALLTNALGKFSTQAAGGTGTSPKMPMAPAAPSGPAPAPVTQAGAQFPGGGVNAARPF